MGWGSAYAIFDEMVEVVMPHIQNPMELDAVVYGIACVLWDGDWDTEQDSSHYARFSHILSAKNKHDPRHPWVNPEKMKHPEPRVYRKKFETEALQYSGHNVTDLANFIKGRCGNNPWGLLALDAEGNGHEFGTAPLPEHKDQFFGRIAVYDYLHTAWIPFGVGDHIAIGPKGESYPINAGVMPETYEEV